MTWHGSEHTQRTINLIDCPFVLGSATFVPQAVSAVVMNNSPAASKKRPRHDESDRPLKIVCPNCECNLDIKHAAGTIVSVFVSASALSKATIATKPITNTSTLVAESPKFSQLLRSRLPLRRRFAACGKNGTQTQCRSGLTLSPLSERLQNILLWVEKGSVGMVRIGV